MGKLLVIEGLDGSGKATQAKLLAAALKDTGESVKLVTFPDYESDSSALVRMYLGGSFGKKPGDVNAYAASSFYAVDRFASFMTNWGEAYNDGSIIIADRYSTSNAIHQCAKLARSDWPKFIDWLEEYEYNLLEIPRPNAVIYLDVEPSVSQKLLTQRYKGDEKRDIHERDVEYLEHCRKAAFWCAKRLGWHLVACTQSDNMRSREEIAREVLRIVQTEIL